MLFSLAACNKEPEKSEKTGKSTEASITSTEKASWNWEGEWKATDTEEHFRIYDITDKGFKCEYYHFEEGQLEKFDYVMEFDNEDRTVASESGSIDDNGGWEYAFAADGDNIRVTWQNNSQIYKKA